MLHLGIALRTVNSQESQANEEGESTGKTIDSSESRGENDCLPRSSEFLDFPISFAPCTQLVARFIPGPGN